MAAAGATVKLLVAGPAEEEAARGGSRAGSVAAAPPSLEPQVCSSTALDEEEHFRDRREKWHSCSAQQFYCINISTELFLRLVYVKLRIRERYCIHLTKKKAVFLSNYFSFLVVKQRADPILDFHLQCDTSISA